MKFRIVIGLVLVAGCVLFAARRQKDSEKYVWTVMCYFDANNDLDTDSINYVLDELLQLQNAQGSDSIAVVALYSSISTNGIATLYEIRPENHTDDFVLQDSMPEIHRKEITAPIISSWAKKDMSDPLTLRSFVDSVRIRYPADHYALVVMDHGLGWKGICVDIINGAGDHMSMVDFRKALDFAEDLDVEVNSLEGSQLRDTFKFDIIYLAACKMGQIEVLYELRNLADYAVVAEDKLWPEVTIRPDWLSYLAENLNTSSLELANQMALSVYNASLRYGKDVTICVVDLKRIDPLVKAIDCFAKDKGSFRSVPAISFFNARDDAFLDFADDSTSVDLKTFMKRLSFDPEVSVSISDDEEFDRICRLTNLAIPYPYSTIKPVPIGGANPFGVKYVRCGIGIYFPSGLEEFNADRPFYRRLAFGKLDWHSLVNSSLSEAENIITITPK